MKQKVFIITVFLVTLSSFTLRFKKNFSIIFSEKNCSVKTDAFGNIYVINNDEIIKYNSLGLLQKKFSTKRYGKIDFLDATNPLKILVYFKDFQQILFLDNQLTASSDMISLETIGCEQASVVCSAANNGFWLYNKQNNELLRFDPELKTVVKTGNLKRILDIDLNPNFIKEHNNFLYLNCPKEGILVFDIYGTFYKTLPIKELKDFSITNNNIYYFEQYKLKEYQSLTFETNHIMFNDTLIKAVRWENNKYYLIYNDSLVVQD